MSWGSFRVSVRVSLVIGNTNFSSNRQYSCCSFEIVFDLSLFWYVPISFCRSFDTNPFICPLRNPSRGLVSQCTPTFKSLDGKKLRSQDNHFVTTPYNFYNICTNRTIIICAPGITEKHKQLFLHIHSTKIPNLDDAKQDSGAPA